MSLLTSSVVWVKKGSLDPFPHIAPDQTPEDIARATASVLSQQEDAMDDESSAPSNETPVDPETARIEQEYGLKDYESEPARGLLMEPYYADPLHDDPQLKQSAMEEGDGSDSEAEESALLPDDLIVLAACTDAADSISRLDVHVYEEGDHNMFCHHDYLLPAFPLSLAYLRLPNSSSFPKNIVAVGSMEPAIGLWDLDSMGALDPVANLGGPLPGKSRRALPPESHRDAVLSLDAHPVQSHILASGSADHTVRLWDAGAARHLTTLSALHQDKVQAVQWCPADPNVLASAGYDRVVALADARADPKHGPAAMWKLPADPEALQWCPWAPGKLFISAEDGSVRLLDAAAAASGGAGGEPVWTLAAHDGAACGMGLSVGVAGLMATGSVDRTVKLWSVKEGPKCVYSRSVGTRVFCTSFCPESAGLLGIGTGQGVRVWDISELKAVQQEFGTEVFRGMREAVREAKHGEEDEEDEEEMGDEEGGKKKKKSDLVEVIPPGQDGKTKKKKTKKEKRMEDMSIEQRVMAAAMRRMREKKAKKGKGKKGK